MNKESHIEHLIRLVRKEQVSLFIGAGFSLEAKAPSAWDLQQAVLSELPSDDLKQAHANDDLDVISQFFVEEVCEGSYWNCVIDTSRKNAGDYPYWYITDETHTSKVEIKEIITIEQL